MLHDDMQIQIQIYGVYINNIIYLLTLPTLYHFKPSINNFDETPEVSFMQPYRFLGLFIRDYLHLFNIFLLKIYHRPL